MNEDAPTDTPRGPARLDSTLSKGLLVVEALAAAPAPRGVSELARELGLTKSNVFRLLQTLAALGYVAPTGDKRYRATLKAWRVGRRVVDNLDLREIAAAALQAVSAATGEAVYLAVPEGREVVYIDKIESTRPIRTWTPVGGSAPIHCVGTGKALLAADYPRLRPLLAGRLTRHTDRTITALPALDAEVKAILAGGCAIDRGEYREGVHSYGAAIHLPDGRAVAALGVSLPEVNLGAGDEARICALVGEAAASVTARLALR